ncbi:MAG: response regulator transcription factor [Lachnospiraceae bacterium]|nr:response regulator transcription factor [Lachnospiraceae bacterium]
MLKIAICDDSRIDVDILESALDKFCQYPIQYDVYYSAEELLEYHESCKDSYQLYIFDIAMPNINGFELAKKIREIDLKALFVFLTSYTQYAINAFEFVTFDYISKPITPEKLEKVLLKVIHYLDMVRKEFVFYFRKKEFCIWCEDIIYIKKKGRQAMIYTDSETYKTNMTTEEIWKQLDKNVFAQIHMSHIINMKYIKEIGKDEVVLNNGVHLILARQHKQSIKDKHMEFMKRLV